MSQGPEELDPEDQILMFITESGFKVVSLQAIVDALSEMETYIKAQTGTNQEELDFYLGKLEELVGKEEAMGLEVQEIINWINVFKGI